MHCGRVFGAGKTRSLAVLLIALSCELDDFYAVVYTKENVAAKALADQISDLSSPTQSTFGRLLGRIEEVKGEAYATKIDVRCSDCNRVIAEKRILIATGGSATAEMAMKYSSFRLWLSRTWLAFMDESQQYGNYHEIAALAAIQQPALIVFVGTIGKHPGPSPKEELRQQRGRSCSTDPWTSSAESLWRLSSPCPARKAYCSPVAGCEPPDSSMWRLAHIEQTRHI